MKFINVSKITGFYKISKEHVFLIDDIQTNLGPKNCIVLNKELNQIYNDNFNITHGMIEEYSGNFYYLSDDGDLYCFNPFKNDNQKIFEEIAFARSRLTISDNVQNTNEWFKNSSDGQIEIRMYIGSSNMPSSTPPLNELYGSAWAK